MKLGKYGYYGNVKDIKNMSFGFGRLVNNLINVNNNSYGIMITDGDNDCDSHGLKVLNSDGIILNNKNTDYLKDNKKSNEKTIYLYIGIDNRSSTPEIFRNIIGCFDFESTKIKFINLGFVTTPILSFCIKNNLTSDELYYEKFLKLEKITYRSLVVDCAFGLGGIVLKKIINLFKFNLSLINFNENKCYFINSNCGTSHVLKYHKLPNNWNNYTYGCSLNGDGSKCIFYYLNEGTLDILDGDYIGILFLYFIKKLNFEGNVNISYVYTYNTSKAVKDFVKNHNVQLELNDNSNIYNEDITINFEKNGSGNIFINNINLLKCKEFNDFCSIINSVSSDGISNLFGVLYCLGYLNLGFHEWFKLIKKKKSTYYKIKAKKIGFFVMHENDEYLIYPKKVQEDLNELMNFYKSYCIIRPYNKIYLLVYIESDLYLNVMKEKVNNLIKKYNT